MSDFSGSLLCLPGPISFRKIRHIVVLTMENHSYDNYLGMLQGRDDGFPMNRAGQPEVFNHGADDEIIRAFRLPSPVQRTGAVTELACEPSSVG